MIENWGQFAAQWGLNPLKAVPNGRARLEPLSVRCPQCDGAGLRSTWIACLDCPMCKGKGRLWTAEDRQIDELYAQLQREYPDYHVRRPALRRLEEVA